MTIGPIEAWERGDFHPMLKIDGRSLRVEDVVAVANGAAVSLDPLALPAISRSRQAVEQLVAEGRVVYGITTGFGRFKDRLIPTDQVKQLQVNLVRSHAAGVGPELDEKTVRAMLLARANTLALGYSGVRPVIIETLVAMLNKGIHPSVPSQGSLGASGDLAPLAHLALALIGEGEVRMNGRRMPSADAFAGSNIAPVELLAKEGLALLNGTAMMAGMGALLVQRAVNLAVSADIAACLTLEALHGTARAYDARVHLARPHPRQIECAAFLREPGGGKPASARRHGQRCAGPVHASLRSPGSWRGARRHCLCTVGDRHRAERSQ